MNKLQVQQQAVSLKNLSDLQKSTLGIKADQGYLDSASCDKESRRGSWPSIRSPTLSRSQHQRFLDKK